MSIYYQPKSYDCVLLGELGQNLSYEFNMLIVVCHTPTQRLFWATDMGCSCPIPFENFHFTAMKIQDVIGVFEEGDYAINTDMTEITPLSFDSFEENAEKFPTDKQSIWDLIWKVKEHLKVA